MISYTCILISLFIPLLTTIYAKLSTKGYSNKNPREFLASLEGRGKRANHAQSNFYETFPAFAIGVVIAHQLNVNSSSIDLLAITYVSMRCLYAIFYITDQDILRSLSWFIAFGSILSLYFLAIT